MAYLLFDIGGTKTRIALSKDGKTFPEPETLATPQEFDEAMTLFTTTARKLVGAIPLTAAAGGVSGTLNPNRTSLVHATHLPAWTGKPILERLQTALGTKVYLENDTAVVGLGEATVGAGRGYMIVVYLTVSTGVGGVKIERGKIADHTFGFEPGFQIINDQTGETLESTISGTAIEKKYGRQPREITDPAVWEECARILALGIHNSVLYWSPEVVVLGGSMMKTPGISLSAVEHYFKALPSVLTSLPPLKLATLGDWGGLYGALSLFAPKFGL